MEAEKDLVMKEMKYSVCFCLFVFSSLFFSCFCWVMKAVNLLKLEQFHVSFLVSSWPLHLNLAQGMLHHQQVEPPAFFFTRKDVDPISTVLTGSVAISVC